MTVRTVHVECACVGFHTCVALRDAICVCVGEHRHDNLDCTDHVRRTNRRLDRFHAGRFTR